MKIKSLEDCKREVAVKHQLGSTLVTGHRAAYWEEAAELYADQFKNPLQNKTDFADQIIITIHKQEKLKGMIDVDGLGSSEFTYSEPSERVCGFQCNYEQDTAEYTMLNSKCQILVEVARSIQKITEKI